MMRGRPIPGRSPSFSAPAHKMVERYRFLLRVAAGCLLLGAAGYLAALRLGYPPAPLNLLVWFPGALMVVLAGILALAVLAALRGRHRMTVAGEAVTAAGLMGVFAAGLANWAMGVQGTVLIMERTPVNLSRRADLVALATGPLSDPRELDVTLALARLRLEGAGPDGFRAVSRLRVLAAGGEEQGITVASDKGASFGMLVFHQGVFGFAPRIVVSRAGATLLDTHVPFRTVREGPEGIAFVEDFEVAADKLLFHGAVTLEDLNDDMRGHPELELAVERDGTPVGKGALRPGEFADLGDGIRVGFAGLQRWSEIIFSRRSYGRAVIAGALVAAMGALAWAAAAWRRW